MRSILRLSCLPLFLFVFAVSCKQADEKPLTKEEVTDFGKQIESSIRKRSSSFMDDAIDAKELIRRSGIKSGKNENAFKRGLGNSMKMGTAVINSLSKKGSYELLRQYEKEGKHHLVFRMYQEGSINYHDMELIRSGGKCKIGDIYIYLTGELFSETVRTLYAQMADEMENSASPSDETTRWVKNLPRIRQLINSEDYEEARKLFNEIPASVRKGHLFQVVNIEITAGLSEEEYKAAMDEYERLFPNQPNKQLLLLDGYILRKDHQRAITAIDELDKSLGTDPLLDYHRALCYSLAENDAKHLECLERLMKNKPYFEDGMIELIATYLEDKEYEKAKPLIDRYKNQRDFNQESLKLILSINPGYQEKYGNS